MNDYSKQFFDFLKKHPSLTDIPYSDTPVENQKFIKINVPKIVPEPGVDIDAPDYKPSYRKIRKSVVVGENSIIIDPNYNNLWYSFSIMDYPSIVDAVAYFKELAKSVETVEQEAQFWVEYFVKPLKDANIDKKNVYFVTTKDNNGWNDYPWDESVDILNGTVEDYVGI